MEHDSESRRPRSSRGNLSGISAAATRGVPSWFALVVGILVLAGLGCGPAERARPPHVILISIDTLRADHLGCYGYPRETSPAIDVLASRGVRFENAFSQASWTLPSHMSVMTSQYASVHGVENDEVSLAESVTTLAEAFRQGGYYTSAFVSWVYVGRSFGFAHGFDQFRELINRDHLQMASGGGAYRAEHVTGHVASWLDAYLKRTLAGEGVGEGVGGGAGEGAGGGNGQDGGRPLFLFVHYFDPHMDYSPPPPYDTMFGSPYSGPAKGTHRYLSRYIKYFPVPPAQMPERDREHVVALYDGEIRYTDDHLGRLLAFLDSKLDLDRCVVALMSDHGEEFGDHGSMEGHGWTLYDEVIRVPLILRLPEARAAGSVVGRPVELIDLAPTLLSLASLDAPEGFQGEDLTRWIPGVGATSGGVGEGVGNRAPGSSTGEGALVYAENARFNIERQAVRGPRFKLIGTADTGQNHFGAPVRAGTEFFDVSRDPGEQSDLAGSDHPVAAYLTRELADFREHTARLAESVPRGEPVDLAPEDIELLRSLGYVR